jgi:hypothetical protein
MLLAMMPLAASAQEFSADEVIHHADGSTSQGKVYVSGAKIRVEVPAQGGRPASVLIVDTAAQRALVAQPEKKTYVEQQGPAAIQPVAFFLPKEGKPCDPAAATKSGMVCKRIGRETVNGRAADKWEATETVSKKPAPARLWIDAKLHCALKWDANPSGGELLNLREGPQPLALFEAPADYKAIHVPQKAP